MVEYIFYQTNDTGHAEYDISGNAYRTLLDVCLKYSHSVAFYISPNYKKDLSEILPYQLPVSEIVKKQYPTYALIDPKDRTTMQPYQIMHFILAPKVKEYLYNQTDHLWGWTYWWGNCNPDDIHFFRKDGSLFFSSTIHDGVCTLYPGKDEDVSSIVKDGNWHSVK